MKFLQMARRLPATMPGSWNFTPSASGDDDRKTEDIEDDNDDISYPEPDLTVISDLLEDIERSPPALQARVLLMQLYAGYGWHDAAKDEAHQVLQLDGSVKEAQTYLDDRYNLSLRGGDGARNGKAREPAGIGPKSKGEGNGATKSHQHEVQPPTWQPSLVEITSPAVSLQELEDGYLALLRDAELLLGQTKLLKDLNAPYCEGRFSNLAAIAKGQVNSVVRVKPLQGVKVVAETIMGVDKGGAESGLNIAVKDLEDFSRWLMKTKDSAESSGKGKSGSSGNHDQDEIREALVKRAKALKALLPQPLQPLADLAMMHAEHEFLHRKYVNDETMSFDAISDIPRTNFWTSEDGYAWDMEELAAAVRSGNGVMRNPLSKQMFSRTDIRAIIQHPLGKGLQALQVEQEKLKHGVRPQTISELEGLAKVLLADMTEDGKPGRVAVEAFASYLETLPRPEQKAIDGLKVPAKDSYTGMAFDTTIGEAVADMLGNRVCLHKTGDFLAQAVKYLKAVK